MGGGQKEWGAKRWEGFLDALKPKVQSLLQIELGRDRSVAMLIDMDFDDIGMAAHWAVFDVGLA